MTIQLKNLIHGIKHQMPISRFLKNYIITRNGWGLFSKYSHINKNGKCKIMYNTLKSAQKGSIQMEKKYGYHYSVYKCIYCNGFHLGKNKSSVEKKEK